MLATITPTPTPTDRSSPAKSAYAIVATFGCLACALFLIVATIVLALIPVYTSTSSPTVSSSTYTSKSADMVIALDDSSGGSRRRGISDNETAYTGASAGSEGLSALKSKLREYILQNAEDIVVDSASIIPKTSTLESRRRRLSKRKDLSGIALRIVYRIIFARTCGSKCQLLSCSALKRVFQQAKFEGVSLSGFTVTLPDGSTRTLNLILGKARSIGDIVPGASSATPNQAGDDATVTTTTSTTTATTTDLPLGATNNFAG